MAEQKSLAGEIRFLEELALNGHVALNSMLYDGWQLRFSKGVTGRANSVSALYPSHLGLREKVAYCEDCYAKQSLPAQFKLTDCDTELQCFLKQRDYEVRTPTDVMLLDLNGSDFTGSTEDCIFSTEPDRWLPVYFELEEITDPARQDIYRQILSRALVDTICCTLLQDGKPAACASAALDRGYLLLQNVIVDPALRGIGLGEKLCRAIIAEGKKQGARHVFLQVVQRNTAALHLYRKLGFRKVYTYCYMRQPAVCFGEPGELDSWMELVRSVRGNFPGLETETGLEEHRQTVLKFMGKRQALCVKSGDEVIGVLLFSRSRNMICCLAVSPAHRRNRVASLLLEKALRELDRSRDITVSTFREGDEKGTAPRALYRKFGFREGELTEEFGYPNQVFVLDGIHPELR